MAETLKVVIKEYGKFYDKRAMDILLDRMIKQEAYLKKQQRQKQAKGEK